MMRHLLLGTVILTGWMGVTGCDVTPPDDDPMNGDPNGDTGQPAAKMFTTAENCAACHNGLEDEAENDVSIEQSWRATMMANAARDPYFKAKVSSEIAVHPALRAVIEDTCAKCHTPMARTQATTDGSPATLFDEGFLNTENPYHELAADGVSCTVCHQIEADNFGTSESFSGGYLIDTTTEMPDRITYGPFPDPDQQVMRDVSGFTPVLGAHIQEAALCATCHTLFTPTVDAAGKVVGEFPEQTPYLEWLHSAFSDAGGTGRTCQDCHMPSATGGVVISTIPADLPRQSPFAQHHFVGGNAYMLRILRDNATALGVQAAPEDFDTVIDRVLDQLTSRAGRISFVDAAVTGGVLTADLLVENLAGHKLPTGYPSRRMWVRFVVQDATGATVFESGAVNSNGRMVADDLENAGSPTPEPHYDLITAEDQVQIYQTVMVNTDNQVTFTLLRAAEYIKDNRVLPTGFDKSSADPDVAVYGAAATDDDFVGGQDTVTYRVDVGDATGPFTLRAELLFQSVAPPFIDDLRGVATAPAEEFIDMADSADNLPIIIDTAEHSVS